MSTINDNINGDNIFQCFKHNYSTYQKEYKKAHDESSIPVGLSTECNIRSREVSSYYIIEKDL